LILDSQLKAGISQSIIAGLFTLILLCFLFFLPVFIGQSITYEDWHLRMWFESWI
jgi:dolichyl-phosphate-mannose-protein mannosyltransferase